MFQPLIGITTYSRDENQAFSLPAAYVDAVRRADGIPVLLPPGEPHLSQLLGRLDGLILAGGGDIDPAFYNGKLHETIYMLDPELSAADDPTQQRLFDALVEAARRKKEIKEIEEIRRKSPQSPSSLQSFHSPNRGVESCVYKTK